ncbi:MAG: hypothetical protein COB09_07035 [Thalassobium sp.]|nr:MAG: hypothetical protein COB09_07035 [Thalassobium sp.]
MRFLLKTCFLFLLSKVAIAAPTIQYQHAQQRYIFPELTVSAEAFFTEFSQYSGIVIYYYPDLIIPEVFRGASLQENEVLRLLEQNFSLIKSFKDADLAALQILPEGQLQSDGLRLAGSTLVETSLTSDVVQQQPALLSDQRVRVLEEAARREKKIAEIKAQQEEQQAARKKKKADEKAQREQRHAEEKKNEFAKLQHYRDTDPEIYQRLLPFYRHRFGEPDFSEPDNTHQP